VEKTIADLDNVITGLAGEDIVEHFTVRTLAFAMITSPANVIAVSMIGIEPETEQYLSQIDEVITEGTYFEGGREQEVVIGEKLAEILEVELGDRVVLTTARAESGELSQEMFRVSGIYRFNIKEMDQGTAFVRLNKARQMLGLFGEAHEIAIKFHDSKTARDSSLIFWRKYSGSNNEAVGWDKIVPQLKVVFELSDYSTLILGIILFGITSLGIINTLFMSLHERMFEFGVLRAVGTRPFAMGRLIMFEAGSLAVISIILGVILGFGVTYFFVKTGIDYTGIEYAGVTFRELLYPVLTVSQFIKYPVWVFIFTLAAAVYPAWFASRMQPANAMRKSF
jgi:ABC-type lipoprotein release transport system permease subunit